MKGSPWTLTLLKLIKSNLPIHTGWSRGNFYTQGYVLTIIQHIKTSFLL